MMGLRRREFGLRGRGWRTKLREGAVAGSVGRLSLSIGWVGRGGDVKRERLSEQSRNEIGQDPLQTLQGRRGVLMMGYARAGCCC